MQIQSLSLAELARVLRAERKRQKLSRDDLAVVCGVSSSFIRDAESKPENCTLGKLATLIQALGLRLELSGLEAPQPGLASKPNLVDYGVPQTQLVIQP
jgi:HTH-type transcriptional regulator / antitoxin HipB